MTAVIWNSYGIPRSLGTLGGPFSYVNAISNAGHAVGGSTVRYGGIHAFLWRADSEVMIDMDLPLEYSMGEAWGINDRDPLQVVGILLGDSGRTAFVWTQAGGYEFPGTLGGHTRRPESVVVRDGSEGRNNGTECSCIT